MVCFLVSFGRPDLMDNYLAFVLSAFISSGLLEVRQTIALEASVVKYLRICRGQHKAHFRVLLKW